MKTQRVFIAVFLAICMVVSNVSPVYALPPLPSSFYGQARINGVIVPDGTLISAWINGVKYAQSPVGYISSAWYSLDVPGDDTSTPGVVEGGVEGSTIVFKIGDLVADQTGTWHSGTNVWLDLTAFQNFPPVITEGDSVNITISEDGSPDSFSLTLNATDDNGDTLTWSIDSPASHGTASASGTGSTKAISYAPAADYNGSDNFVVQVSDGNGGTDSITVNVTIEPINDAPVANNQSVSTLENTAKNITLSASDVDGDLLTYFLGSPSHGVLSGAPPNVTYTPDTNYSGPDSFTFYVNDGTVNSNTATVSITVELVNVAPVCSAVSLSTNEDVTGEGSPSCTDGDGDPLTYSIVTQPTNGTASVVSGLLRYTPDANYNGPDSLTYRAFDGLVYSNTANVTVTVNAVNDAPVANPQSITTAEDTPRALTLTGSDIDSGTLTYEVTGGPAHGTLTGTGANRSYTPFANYFGADSFTFKVNDGSLDSAPAVINITVTPVNDAPVAVADSYNTAEDTALTVAIPGVLGNDSDVDGDPITAIKVTNPANGTVTLNADGSFTYTPHAYFNGVDSFTYKVNDGHVDGNTVTVTVNVSSVNNAPVCSPVSLTTAEDASGQADPSCTDPDGDSMIYSIVNQPSHGMASVVAGKLVYLPDANFFGADSFTYKAGDAALDSNVATVTVTVTAVNDAPTVSDITDKSTNEDTATGLIPFTVGDVETAAASLTVTAVSSNTALVPNANITLGGTGADRTINIVPVLNQSGTTTITVTVSDGEKTASDTFVLTVTAVNDLPTIGDITDKSTTEDTATGAIPFVVGDVETAVGSLTVTAVSSNTALVPNANIALGGAGENRTINITPASNQSGITTITVTVTDANSGSATDTFVLTVDPINDLPTISDITNKSTDEDTATGNIAFTVSDVETAVDSLTVAATSSNTALVPNANIALGGVGTNRTINITPALNQSGTTTITVTVMDGDTGTTSDTFVLTVIAVNDPPTVGDITDKSTTEDTATGTIPFAVGDVETAAGSLVVTAASSNITLVPNANITLGGTGANRTIALTPAANQFGATTITVTVSDGEKTTSDTFVLTVTAVNDAPLSVGDSYNTAEDTPLTVSAPGVLSNDTDVDGDSLTAVLVDEPEHGTLILNTNGSFTYTPDSLYHGADGFTYKANDGAADSNVVTVTISISSVNNLPVAVDDTFAATEDTVKNLPFSGAGSPAENDADPDGDALTVSAVSSPVGGTVTLSGGTITFTPTTNLCGAGAGKFTYTVSDGNGGADTGLVTLNIACVNDAPVADPQSVNATEDTPLPITLTGSDIDGDSLTYTITVAPQHGTLSGAAPNLTYTPFANYNGADSFTFKVNDATMDSAPAIATISVAAVNDAPVADPQSVTTAEDTAKAITLSGSDVDTGTILTFSIVDVPTHGTLSGTPPAVTYTPNTNYFGADSFTFRVSDGTLSDTATISIMVTPVNDAPVAANNVYATAEDTVLTVPAPGVLGNDTDVEGDPLEAIKIGNPSNGIVTLNADGSFTYTPNPFFNGTDSFTYKANDGAADSNIATVTINISSVNNAPVCSPVSLTTAEDTSGQTDPSCTDADGNTLDYLIVDQPEHGSASVVSGKLVYLPATNFFGSDSFTYKANDGTADSNVAAVTVTVTAVNDVPVANPQSVTTAEDTAKAITLTGSDVESTVTFTLVAGPAHGTLTGALPNLTYTPAANYFGPDSFTFKVNDGTVDSAPATVSITVTAVNDLPVADPQSVTTAEDTAKAITLTGSDVESSITFSIVTGPSHGTLSGTAPNLTYTPAANYNGSDSFTFKVSDGAADSAPATISITVTAVNDAPVAVADSYTTPEDTTLTIAAPGVLNNDTDVEGTTLTATLVSGPSHGTLTLNTNGSFTYVPAALYHGVDGFTYKASDGAADSNVVSVTINVSSVNNPPVAVDDTITATEDTVKTLPASGAGSPAANDTDPDGDVLTVSAVSNPVGGTVSLTGGTITFTPSANLCGTGAGGFTYVVSDGQGRVDTGLVTLNIACINDVPVANSQSVTTPEDAAKAITLTGSDADPGTTLTFTVLTQPAHGTLSGTAPNLTYTPNLNYNGSDSFTFRVNDGTVNSNTATVSITVTPVNDAPVANDQSVATNEDTAKAITLTGSDVDSATLTYSIVAQPLHGTLTGTPPTVTYTPAAHYFGPDSFTFKITDGSLESNVAMVSITVTPKEYTLSVAVVGHGSVTKTPDKATYHYGEVVQLSAVADAGWQFVGWSGDLSGVTNPQSITITGNKSVTATFAEIIPIDTTITSQPPLLSNSASASFAFTSNVGGATFECELDGAGFVSCDSPKEYTGLNDGTHVFKVRAKDGGNIDTTPAAYTWTIDATAPTVTIDQGVSQVDPTTQLPIVFDVVFSEPVTGFTNADVSVTGTAPGTKTVVVSGSGALYTVKVSGLTGTGTVTAAVAAGAAQDTAGNLSTASSSTDDTVTFNLMVKPGVPTLLQPANGAVTADTTPWFDWTDSDPAAAYYRIQIAGNIFFIAPMVDQTNVTDSEFTPVSGLIPGFVYFWRVKAYSPTGEASNWSSIRYFRLVPSAPTLLSPANAEPSHTLRPYLDWSSVMGAAHYTIQISKNSSFTQIILKDASVYSAYIVRKNLPAGTTLYWRVRAESFAGASAWSETWSFTTPNPPGVPTLLSPHYGSVTTTDQPLLKWYKSSLPAGTTFDHYQLQIATSTSFNQPLVDVNIAGWTNVTYQPVTPLASNAKYFWRVRAANTDGDFSNWSSTWMFYTPRTGGTLWRSGIYAALRENADASLTAPTTTALQGNATRPMFDWNDIPGATGYMIQVATEPTFASAPLLVSTTTVDSGYSMLEDLTPGTTVYWRVLTIRGKVMSDWSSVSSFEVP